MDKEQLAKEIAIFEEQLAKARTNLAQAQSAVYRFEGALMYIRGKLEDIEQKEKAQVVDKTPETPV